MKIKPNIREVGFASGTKRQTKGRLATILTAATMIASGGLISTAHAELVQHGVSAGMLKVSQIPDFAGADENDNVIVELDFSINDFRLGPPYYFTNASQVVTDKPRADFNVQIGSSAEDDVQTGVMISSISQNGSNNYGTTGHASSSVAVTDSVSYRLVTHLAEIGEYNSDVAGAWFPYSKYLGGYARNANGSNGSASNTNNLLTASPGIQLDTHFIGIAGGRYVVDLTSFGVDSRTDGVLLVSHAKDENNWALSHVISSNGTWGVTTKDIGSASAGSVEQDPVSFVYIPKSDTNLISGRFFGNGSIDIHSGDSPQFTITPLSGGRWDLKVPGHSPTTGILIISAQGGFSQNQDNIISYEINAAGDGWEIHSRDTPGNGLQTPGGGSEPVASIVFIPAATPGFTVTPTENLLTTESGGTATFDVALHSLPEADVVINVASDNSAEGIASPATLTFTPADWNVPQAVTVTGQDDGATDGSVSYNVVLSPATSSDPAYNGVNPADVSVVNGDNEIGVTVSAVSVTTTEAGGTGSFTVRLNTAPASDVLINITSSDTTEGTVSANTLFFTTANWSEEQSVTVTGADDFVDDGNVGYTIQTEAISSDANYNLVNVADVAATNVDNDTAGITLSPASGLSVSESGTTTQFTVVLNSQPTANVTVTLTSGDLSEGTVSPSVLNFTTSDWSTPKPVTLTGVNDSTNDGNVNYDITGSVSSSDALYAAQQPVASATTVDNEAALTLPSGVLTYSIGTPGTSIDAMATVDDADTANYNSGSLTVSLTANGTADDRLEVRNSGSGPGQIGVSGNTVSYEGVGIGTSSGGVGTSPLIVSLNGSATPVAVQALVRAITFHNVNSAPSTSPRTVTLSLADGQGGTSSATKTIQFRLMRVFNFQEGVDHGLGVYSGGADTELNGIDPDVAYPAGSSVDGLWVAWQSGLQNRNVLMRFDNIIGNGPTQIPANAIIVSADLILTAANPGDGSPLYRMLTSWDATNATWNSINPSGGGVAFDDVQARSTFDSQIGVADLSGASTTGPLVVSVTPDVQAWVNGEANYGWVMPGWPFNGDGTGFVPTESTDPAKRPHLRVKWLPAGTASASFRQNVNGYVGARDTRIGEDAPDTDASLSESVFVDGEATGGEADQVQVLLRFDDIIGNGAGQVPQGATVHAAILELASLGNNAMGDGGTFHALLKPWEDTATWTFWGGRGVVADGVDALVTPTAIAGSPELIPDVQGGYLNFELTSDVQAWVNNVRPNYGWAILPWPLGGNGWGIGTAESVEERARPQLRVYYTPGGGEVAIQLLPLTVTPTSVTVRFSGAIGESYSVLRAETLTGSWSNLGSATVQGDGTATFNDNAPLSTTAFYRISKP